MVLTFISMCWQTISLILSQNFFLNDTSLACRFPVSGIKLCVHVCACMSVCVCVWKLGICQGSTPLNHLFRFNISRIMWALFHFPFLSLSPFPSLLYRPAGFCRPSRGSTERSKRDGTGNWKKDLNFPEGVRGKGLSAERRAQEGHRQGCCSSYKGSWVLGSREAGVGSGTQGEGAKWWSLSFQTVDLCFIL